MLIQADPSIRLQYSQQIKLYNNSTSRTCLKYFDCTTIKWKWKYHTVRTVLKYHTVRTVLKYHTVRTVLKYHTVRTVIKYHTVRTVLKYHTVRTVIKFNRNIVEIIQIGTPNTNTWPLTFLAWYRHLKKSGRVKLVLWTQIKQVQNNPYLRLQISEVAGLN